MLSNMNMEKYDFTQMKPFTKVLVRNGNYDRWLPQFFESFHPENVYPFYMIGGKTFAQCVPYEDGHNGFKNEYLYMTKEPIPEFYNIKNEQKIK